MNLSNRPITDWIRQLVLSILLFSLPSCAVFATNLVIVTVNNDHMIQLREHSYLFEKANPDIKLKWVILEEHELRQSVSNDILLKNSQFDVMTIGMYEVPIWAERDWIKPFIPSDSYDEKDLLPTIRDGLSYKGRLFASPIYGESSMLMYRKDLMRSAGLTMPEKPTWAEIADFAAKLNDTEHGIHGICLRGKPGWGENMTLLTPMVNAHGGQWFDMKWRAQLDSQPWKDALNLYVDLLSKYGPADSTKRGYNENLALFEQGKCGIWIDATVAAGFVTDPKRNKWAAEVGFTPAPSAVTAKGSHWLWAWALAIPSSVRPSNEAAAQRFINWATSREYIRLVASLQGWGLVPSGSRYSIYENPEFQAVTPWSKMEMDAILTADPTDATLSPSPYKGVQLVMIPEFRFIGDEVGKLVARAVEGRLTIDQALAKAQYITSRQMSVKGYR